MNKIIKLMMTMILAAFSASASSVPITDVGTIDEVIGQTTLTNSGELNEETWIESVLTALNGDVLVDIAYTQLSETISSGEILGNWETVDGGAPGDYALDFGLGIEPAYFLIKVGGGNGTLVADTHFLYENNASMQWAFLNLSDFGPDVTLTNIGVISHVGSVPEPGMVGLLAIGLIGMVAAARRRMKL